MEPVEPVLRHPPPGPGAVHVRPPAAPDVRRSGSTTPSPSRWWRSGPRPAARGGLQLRAGLVGGPGRLRLLTLCQLAPGDGGERRALLRGAASPSPAGGRRTGAMLATARGSSGPSSRRRPATTATVVLGLFRWWCPGSSSWWPGYLAMPAVMAEPDVGPEGALRRSFVLTEGHRTPAPRGVRRPVRGEQLAVGPGAGRPWRTGRAPASLPAVIAVDTVDRRLLGGLTSCSVAVAYPRPAAAQGRAGRGRSTVLRLGA